MNFKRPKTEKRIRLVHSRHSSTNGDPSFKPRKNECLSFEYAVQNAGTLPLH